MMNLWFPVDFPVDFPVNQSIEMGDFDEENHECSNHLGWAVRSNHVWESHGCLAMFGTISSEVLTIFEWMKGWFKKVDIDPNRIASPQTRANGCWGA